MSTITAAAPAPTELEAPPFVPSPNGLLSTVTVRDDPALRWASPGAWYSEAGAGVGGAIVSDPCVPMTGKGSTVDETWLTSIDLVLYAWWTCSPTGFSIEEARARSRDALLRGESFGLEERLWPWLIRGGVTAALTPLEALGSAECAIAIEYGGQGLVHMDRLSATLLSAHLARNGSQLRTIGAGTPVVVGDGYPCAASGVQVAATGPMVVTRGGTLDLTPQAGNGVDRALNDLVTAIERGYRIQTETPQGKAFSAPPCAC